VSVLRRFFLHDLGRKALALGLASLLWWQVNQTITVERTVTLVVDESLTGRPGETNVLRLVAPEGWVLSVPRPGEAVQIVFKGPNSQLEGFLASCSASLTLALPQGESPYLLTAIDAASLDWTRPDEAKFFLAGIDRSRREIAIQLDRRADVWLDLAPGMVPVRGAASPGYEVRPAELAFRDVTRIHLEGPQRTVKEITDQVSAARANNGEMPALFDTLDASGARSDVGAELGLDATFAERRLSIQPASVRVQLPVRRSEPSLVGLTLAAADVHLIGEPAGGLWAVADFQREFQVELHDEPGLALTFDENWVATHLFFYVPLWSITSDAVDTQQVRVQWAFWGAADATQEAQLKRALQVRAVAGEQDWNVELRKLDN